MALRGSEVDESLATTLEEELEAFWYFNNGVTAPCQSIVQSAAYGTHHRGREGPPHAIRRWLERRTSPPLKGRPVSVMCLRRTASFSSVWTMR
ncbi:hypothetical protein [Kitasatospora sp. McL0602]|uniref:hypothetical protein n=1 Tax=Kitasatospora sp. McL0602 TaxID=3439530 RepID=UPI003F8AE7E6